MPSTHHLRCPPAEKEAKLKLSVLRSLLLYLWKTCLLSDFYAWLLRVLLPRRLSLGWCFAKAVLFLRLIHAANFT